MLEVGDDNLAEEIVQQADVKRFGLDGESMAQPGVQQ